MLNSAADHLLPKESPLSLLLGGIALILASSFANAPSEDLWFILLSAIEPGPVGLIELDPWTLGAVDDARVRMDALSGGGDEGRGLFLGSWCECRGYCTIPLLLPLGPERLFDSERMDAFEGTRGEEGCWGKLEVAALVCAREGELGGSAEKVIEFDEASAGREG